MVLAMNTEVVYVSLVLVSEREGQGGWWKVWSVEEKYSTSAVG